MWDLLVRGGLVHDGSGGPPRRADVAIAAGRIRAVAARLDHRQATATLDARGQWVVPGFVDPHAHVDLALHRRPGLPAHLRHGTTTVTVGTCGIGLALGPPQRDDGWLAALAATEGLSATQGARTADAASWHDVHGFLEHLRAQPLGPNVASFVPLRSLVDVAGRAAAPGERRATTAARLLDTALAAGLLGLSSGPGHHAGPPAARGLGATSRRRLLRLVRTHEATWQVGLDVARGSRPARLLRAAAGRRDDPALRVLAVATHDGLPATATSLSALARLAPAVGVALHPTTPPRRLRVWGHGPVTPLATGPLAHLQDPALGRAGRRSVLADRDWQHDLADWWRSRPRSLAVARPTLPRNLWRLHVGTPAPVPAWQGESLGALHRRVVAHQDGEDVARSEAEHRALDVLPPVADDEPAFLVALFATWDLGLPWWTRVRTGAPPGTGLGTDGTALPCHATGAHPAHHASHGGGLRLLRAADAAGPAHVPAVVHALTRQPADLLGLDAGRIGVGARADVVMLDPERLRAGPVDDEQLVEAGEPGRVLVDDRAEGVVTAVVVGGRVALDADGPTPVLRTEGAGAVLRRHRAARSA